MCAGWPTRPAAAFEVDVNVDTGFLGLGEGELLNVVQDLVIQPIWLALVWSVRAAMVALEWCFALDPFSHAFSSHLAAGLRTIEATLTYPALAFAFGALAMLTAYHGVVRRRTAYALSGSVAAVAMTVGALGITGNPGGTVGALFNASTSLATSALSAASGAVGHRMTLHGALDGLESRLLQAPWCYLEFGNVGWCQSSKSTDPSLYRAALAVAAEEVLITGCDPTSADRRCSGANGAFSVAHSVRSAQTNGELFLAFPAAGEARNDAGRSPSLLNALCGAEELSACRGPTAAEAEFRTSSGTWPRLAGLILIAVGVVGALALVGWISLRLVVATGFTLLLLIAAPAVALAPAFGERGRSVFWAWLERLVVAAIAKTLYAFVLGAVFVLFGFAAEVVPHRWITDWLLTACLSWGLFFNRRALLRTTNDAGRRRARFGGLVRAASVGWLLESSVPRSPRELVRFPNSSPTPERRYVRPQNSAVDPVAGSGAVVRSRRLEAAIADARQHGDRRREVSLQGRVTRLHEDAPAGVLDAAPSTSRSPLRRLISRRSSE